MIAMVLEGRLGNQLFQYAFIYATAKRLNTSFYLDKSIENFTLSVYFEVKEDFLKSIDNNIFSIQGYKNIFRVHGKKAFYNSLGALIFRGKKMEVDNETPVNEVLRRLKNHYHYKGFFHSESYFHDVKDEIRTLFSIKKKYVDAFERVEVPSHISKKKVVIHVRRTDYVGLNMSLPVSYYKKAIEIIENEDLTYIFVSDDPAFIEKEFGYIKNKYISTHNEIIDLQYLMNADICILSNSSFSWWGAWLNNKKNKKVYAPKHWLGFKTGKEFPAGVSDHLNINWIKV